MKNTLVLGGTGMLKGLVLKLLDEHFRVFVVGRNAAKFSGLETMAGARAPYLTFMALDYHELGRLEQWVAHLQLMHGPLDVVVAWIHGGYTGVIETVDREVGLYRVSPWDLYHVQGIRASVSSEPKPAVAPNCRYHRVVLGYVDVGSETRWLHHEEIVQGVYDAVMKRRDAVVGTVEPYEGRPG